MGQLGIHHDSHVTENILSLALENSIMKFATGYFNLTENYMNTLTNNCQADCSILMAHPNVNTYFIYIHIALNINLYFLNDPDLG